MLKEVEMFVGVVDEVWLDEVSNHFDTSTIHLLRIHK